MSLLTPQGLTHFTKSGGERREAKRRGRLPVRIKPLRESSKQSRFQLTRPFGSRASFNKKRRFGFEALSESLSESLDERALESLKPVPSGEVVEGSEVMGRGRGKGRAGH